MREDIQRMTPKGGLNPTSPSYAHARRLVEQADEEVATRALIGPPGPTQQEVLEAMVISPGQEGPDPGAAIDKRLHHDWDRDRDRIIHQSYRAAERLYLQAANLYYNERPPDHFHDQAEALIQQLPAHLRTELSTIRSDYERDSNAGAARGWDDDEAFDRTEAYLASLRERLQAAAPDLYAEHPNRDASRSRD